MTEPDHLPDGQLGDALVVVTADDDLPVVAEMTPDTGTPDTGTPVGEAPADEVVVGEVVVGEVVAGEVVAGEVVVGEVVAGEPAGGDVPADGIPVVGGATGEDPAADAGFGGLGLRPELLSALETLGYEEPTPIQARAIPPLLAGHDLLGQAATGTGKTAAFALPALNMLAGWGRHDADAPREGDARRDRESGRVGGPTVLVLVPTRELAVQVSQAFHRYGRQLGAKVLPIYGGQPIHRQIRELQRGVDVVVATPGRALDHLERGTLTLAGVRLVVLDEADEMLDMGFAEDIESILGQSPSERQTVLFSATLPPRIGRIAGEYLNNPVRIEIERETTAPGEAPKVRQTAYLVQRSHKPAALGRLLDVESPGAALVFCRTREEVDEVTETLNGRGYRAEALHGGMSQEQRDRVMNRLRSQTADLLVATDVAARGLDVDHLTHVVNYTVPSAADSYVHRIGRVGRAGREGVAITLVEPREHRMLKSIERLTRQKIIVSQVPSVADLRARRLELTRASLYECLLQDDLEPFRVVVESLADEFDVMEVALAAVRLAHDATASGGDDDQEIPVVTVRPERPARPGGDHAGDPRRHEGTGYAGGGERGPGRGRERGPRRGGAGMTRLFVSIGRHAGVRPQDLVGAITGETELAGRDIGAIEITDRFSLVEIPDSSVESVIAALSNSRIKGSRATVRRERPDGARER